MLYKIKEFYSDRIPTDDDIKLILDNPLLQEGYIIRLWWQYYGNYEIYIKPGMTLEKCKAMMPNGYPV